MKKTTFLFALILLFVQFTFSQETYKKVSINNVNDYTFQKLDQLGIDLTCGVIITDDNIQIELSQSELNRIEESNISYSVLIEDMAKFYRDRAKADAPKAIANLNYEKALSQQVQLQKSFSVNEVINNVGQYNDCDEINWAVPANWNLNPFLNDSDPNTDDFGGCLTYDMVLQELDDMRTYSINNGLNIISEKLDASLVSGEADLPANKQQSVEGRTIYYVRISDNPDTDETGEPETLYQSLIHSRESATVMNQLFFMWYILENYNTDTAIQNLVNNQALYFIPVFNPDGFVHNENIEPNGGGLQRKNRNLSLGSCGSTATSDDYGIDLNRNSDYYYNNGGASSDPCSQTYRGSGPFSEPETQIMRDFFLDHDFELALNHHSFKNAMLHAYAGVGSITNPRPDEYSKYNHDMTHYNRYAHGPSTSISGLNSGNMNDWMLGGSVTDPNGSTGSGKQTMAWTPENGLSSEAGSSGSGFWPAPSNFLPIARRAMRMNFMAAYFSGKYAKLHDLNQHDITATSGNLEFAIENLGQQASDFTLTVTAVSNITIPGASNTVMESFDAADVLEQRIVSIPYTLSGLSAEDEIEFKVVLTNNYASDNVLYEANIKKTFTPNVMFVDNPDTDILTNWTSSGSWTTTSDSYSGTRAIKSNATSVYATNQDQTLQLNGSLDFTNKTTVLLQYYAKWDLERSYDFVVIEGSTDGSSWTELCGKLTKPGAPTANNSYSSTSDAGDSTVKTSTDDARQNGITALYDGDTQDKWNMEEVVIDVSNNSFLFNQGTVFLRFRLRTDSSNRKDSYANADFEGFSFDDFKVIEVKIPCVTSVPTTLAVNNITTTTADITWDAIPSANYDLRYRETGTSTWTDVLDLATNSYTITALDNLTEYEVQVRTKCTSANSAYTTSEIFTTLEACLDGTISTFPYTQDFENNTTFTDEWSQGVNSTDDDIDWTRDSGGTLSNNTGPSTGASGSTWYIYTEASTNVTPAGSPQKTAIITSDCIDFTNWENAKISFDYHMFGTDLGSSTENPIETGYVAVEVSEDDGLTYNTETIINDDSQNAWKSATDIDLSAYDGKIVLIRFRGVTGSSWSSDMALDNINITADVAVNSAPPVAVCQDITIQLDNTGNATIIPADVDGGSTDDVAITNTSVDISAFDCSNIGTPVTVTLTVEDADGQTDTCTATVTVEDQVDPEFVNVPANIALTCGNNQPTWTDPTVSDNCATGLTATRTDGTGLNSGDVFPTGITTISYSVSDGNGNANTASFTVDVSAGSTTPTAICQNITIQLDATGNATITAADINNGSTDDCGIASISASQTAFTCADEGTNNVVLTVTNINSNTDTCTAVVTVTLQDAPTGLECWETANYNYGTCMWDVSGSQDPEPTATNCWDNYQFNNGTCEWVNLGVAPSAPTNLAATGITTTTATLNWDVQSTLTYDLRYRQLGSAVWNDITDIVSNSQGLTSLLPSTQYEVEVRSKCSITETSNYTTALIFATLDDTTDYCASTSTDDTDEHISRVQLGSIDNSSGASNYTDYTNMSTVLRKGTQYTITITPTWTPTVYNEAYSVWIDYNNDGDFEDAGEQVYTEAPTQATSVSGDFTIPTGAIESKTRMRVSMKWNGIPDPCETFQYGEVEDYTVVLVGSGDLIYESNAWTPYAPSPTTGTDNALVIDGTYNVTDDIQINNIKVCDGAGIVIEKAKSMTVNGDLTTSDNVVLESDSNEYSSLIVDNIVTGVVQYNRHVNDNAGGNDLIAPPVYGESFIDFKNTNSNILSDGANTLFLFGPFDKITDTYVLYSDGETAPMTSGRGYRAASTDNGTFTFTGLVKMGDLSVSIVNDGPNNPEWNLIGNPYPAFIDLSDFLAVNSSQFDTQSAGIYGYNANASNRWTIWNQAYSDANPDAVITPGQGFFVSSATNSGQINFTPSMRRISNDDDFIQGRQDGPSIVHLKLKLNNDTEGNYHTDFYFTDNASNGMDFNYDASIYGEQAPSDFAIYSHLLEDNVGIDMAIQSLGFDALTNAVIPLGVHIEEGQQITISIAESDLPDNIQVFLEDTIDNTFTLLNNADYTMTPTEDLNDIGRYVLRFNEDTLNTSSTNLDTVEIYTTTQPKSIIVSGRLFEDTQLSIYDIQGRLIQTTMLQEGQTTHKIDASSLTSGVYIVSLENNTQKKSQKVVIK
ncbi:M14 family zinc carboxypeptidase [Psychroserpens sp. MEBiC05023]